MPPFANSSLNLVPLAEEPRGHTPAVHFPTQVPTLVKEPSQKVLPDSEVIPQPLDPAVLHKSLIKSKTGTEVEEV